MSSISVTASGCESIEVEYRPSRRADWGGEIPASVTIWLDGRGGRSMVSLAIEHVRLLAEQLPDLLMSHDSAERAAKEQAAAQKAVAASKAA